jgi:menaquinol-cytochrome c reductase iron-sulfur subunit
MAVESHHPAPPPPRRRDFLKKFAATVIGGLVVAVPGLAGLAVYFDPIRRKRKNGNGGGDYTDVAPLSAVPADGVPRRFQVLAKRADAWNRHPAAPVGAVYLKRPKETPDTVLAFNVVCPHAGCFVEPGNADHPGGPGGFFCPCHNSAFHPDGSIVRGKCVSPRGLDDLDVDPEGLRSGVIRVRFQNFVPGTHQKTPVA